MDAELNQAKSSLEEFTFIDKSHLEKYLTCNVCSRHLNVSPVMYSEGFGNVCGRCSTGSALKGLGVVMRQQVFEELAKNLTFPCGYKAYGCTEVLRFNEVQAHERTCRFQCTNCPLVYQKLFPDDTCSWSGNIKKLNDHLIGAHQNKFQDPPQFQWPEEGHNMIFFTGIGTQIATVVIKHEIKGKFTCLVMINGTDLESQCFRYQLELANEDQSHSLVLRRSRLEPFCEMLEAIQFPEKTLEVDIDKISDMLMNSKKVFGKFGIVKKHKKEIVQITGVKDGDVLSAGAAVPSGKGKNPPFDEEMLTELECPICNEYMVSHIYLCAAGHSVCGDCKSRVYNCPTCRRPYEEGRNFTLEKVATKVKYPCRNREIGCGFVTTSDKIKQHQKICDLSENPCILKCGWKGLGPSLYPHFLETHSAQLLEHNTVILKDLKQDKNLTHHFFYVMGDLFCLSYKNCGKFTIRFNMQHVGHVDDDPKYKYTVQFTLTPDSACPNLALTNFCQRWTGNLAEPQFQGNLNGFVIVSGDILKPFVFQNHLFYFKVNITKV